MADPEIPAGVEFEQVFLIEAQYSPEAAERRPAVRAEHIARLLELKRAGTIIEAGAYSDGLTSSLLMVRAGSADEALGIAHQDVYVSSGVWAGITARPFGRVTIDG